MPADDRALAGLLARSSVPPGFERWRSVLEPRSERATHPAEWAGALVLIESGVVEVTCRAGGQRTFRAGDLIALGWLPITRLRNPSDVVTRIVAVRRSGAPPTEEYVRIVPFRARQVR
jgi:hypothetical protein